jgi:hypothetical protein
MPIKFGSHTSFPNFIPEKASKKIISENVPTWS